MDDPDADLATRASQGDATAFGELVARHQDLLAAMLHRYAQSHADLEDLVQESFVKAWQALPRWKPKAPFLHWLKRIAVRTALEYCRKAGRAPLRADEKELAKVSVGSREHALQEVKEVLSFLPAEDRVLLSLVYLDGLSMEEASDYFGWSRAKAKVRSFRARQSLRKLLKSHGYEE